MKVRNSFVPNSSSSSFCIFGTMLKEEDVKKMANDEHVCVRDFIDNIIGEKKLNLNCYTIPEQEGFYIGRGWKTIQDDQTGKEFKEDIKKQLVKLCGDSVELKTHDKSWYNG